MAGLIYTSNVGGYDTPKALHIEEPDIDYAIFTDGKAPPGCTAETPPKGDARKAARCVKVMTPWELHGYDWFLWIDGTMQIKAPVTPLIEKLLESKHDFAAFKHNEWQCSYTEIQKCIERKKDDPLQLLHARVLLEKQKLPKNFGQAATGVLWRRNTDEVKAHALAWWLDMQATTMRDQATFMLNLWNKKIYLEWIPGLHTDNKWFDYHRGHLK